MPNQSEGFSQKVISFFEELSSQPEVGGLQITNSSIHYVSFREGEQDPIYFSSQIPPGVIRDGRVQDPKKLYEILQAFTQRITKNEPEDRVRVVASLPSNVVYTQNFSVPNVGDKKLEESASLNLQMMSPIPVEDAYMSWQLISESDQKYGLLGAFAYNDVVDKYKQVLLAAGFQPVAIEFPSLSLSWTVNRILGPKEESILVLNVYSDGIDIFLLKNGYIYFDYFKSWRSVQEGEGEIGEEAFREAITEEVRRVKNFTSSNFQEELKYAYFVAPGMENRVRKVIEDNFQMSVAPLQARFGNLGPAWFPVIGSAIRATWEREKDRFISIGTEKVETMYYREQTLNFIRRWRDIFGITLLVFLVIFAGAAFILRQQPDTIRERLSGFNVQAQQEEYNELQEEAERFNNLVESIGEIRENAGAIPNLIANLRNIGNSHNITIGRLDVQSLEENIELRARAPDSNTVIRFKNALVENEKFENVDLPFGEIVTAEGGFVRFNISFKYNPNPGEEEEGNGDEES